MTPIHVPDAQKNMISCVKEYERLAVEAIMRKDKFLAIRALMAHPLIGSGRWPKSWLASISTKHSLATGNDRSRGVEWRPRPDFA